MWWNSRGVRFVFSFRGAVTRHFVFRPNDLVASVPQASSNVSGKAQTCRRILLVRIHRLHVGIPETAGLGVE
jgi:hypothetical protein